MCYCITLPKLNIYYNKFSGLMDKSNANFL